MKPLRVEFDLATPIALPSMPIHLDALLAYAVTEDAIEALGNDQGQAMIRDLADNFLPDILGRHEAPEGTTWQASALTPEGIGESWQCMWTRKTDPYDYAMRLKDGTIASRAKWPLKPYALIIDTVRGPMKNSFEFYGVRDIKRLKAWCIGEEEAIRDVLESRIRWIGKRGKNDHGRVIAVRVAEDDAAMEKWKLRILPWQEPGYVPVQAAHKPPYWAIENRTLSYLPPEILW
jgi:CRISPR type IV-associated protein Csf3